MNAYLEIIEQLSDEDTLTKQAQMVRIEVRDEEEAKEKATFFKKDFEGLEYKKFFHIHRVDEKKGCIVNEF